jgi:hypothetical protein
MSSGGIVSEAAIAAAEALSQNQPNQIQPKTPQKKADSVFTFLQPDPEVKQP